MSSLQIKFRQFHIRRSRDLDIPRRPHHDGHVVPRSFHHRSFVGAHKSVRRSLIKRLLNHAVAKTLRRLRHDDTSARNGRFDQCSLRRALDLLHRIDRGQPGNRSAILLRRFNHFLNDFTGHKRAHRIVHQNDIVGCRLNCVERTLHRLLPVLPANNKLDFLVQKVLRFVL